MSLLDIIAKENKLDDDFRCPLQLNIHWQGKIDWLIMRAKEKNLDFNLDAEHLEKIFPSDEKCPIFGTKFVNVKEQLERYPDPDKRPYDYNRDMPTVDRIDNDKGYVYGNVMWVSKKANHVKNNLTNEELRLFVNFYGNELNKIGK